MTEQPYWLQRYILWDPKAHAVVVEGTMQQLDDCCGLSLSLPGWEENQEEATEDDWRQHAAERGWWLFKQMPKYEPLSLTNGMTDPVESKHFNQRFESAAAAVLDASYMPEDGGYLVNRINVPAAHRGKGVGGGLMAQLLAWADAERWPLRLQVSPYSDSDMQYEALLSWYVRLGFVQEGATPMMTRAPR
jgi:GNAT superfamily N-acetyltransferase